ncbi:preprotein translocase subunit YajC [Fibrella arboris]|uniref:preprotein translocase subunit YajC n=1 Tax=Fibrella arboris TaxID=3242486 RepID=UPI0035211CF5
MHTVLAQATSQIPQGVFTFALWGGVLAVMYFFMIRPQQKKAKDQKNFVSSMKKGDSVVTIGGLHGKIASVEATTVTLEVDRGTKLTFEKSAISREATVKPEADKA